MSIKPLTKEQEITQAIEDYHKAFQADLKVTREITRNQILKKKTHNDLVLAGSRLRGLQLDLMSDYN